MFPGYVAIYKDKDRYVHLYFFKGIDNLGHVYYKDIDLSNCKIAYTYDIKLDGAIDYKFNSKKIKSIVCNLISYTDKRKTVILTL